MPSEGSEPRPAQGEPAADGGEEVTTKLSPWSVADTVSRLSARISSGLDELAADQREHVQQAVATLRRHRSVMLGMPRIRQALPDLRPERTA
jgi:hypothetical protein